MGDQVEEARVGEGGVGGEGGAEVERVSELVLNDGVAVAVVLDGGPAVLGGGNPRGVDLARLSVGVDLVELGGLAAGECASAGGLHYCGQ